MEHLDFFAGYARKSSVLAAVDAVHRRQDSDEHQPYPEQRVSCIAQGAGIRIVIASHGERNAGADRAVAQEARAGL